MTTFSDLAKKQRPPLERDVQRRVIALYRGVRCHVTVFSEGRKARITPGTPDLWVQPQRMLGFWHETKVPGGKQSKEQRAFQERSMAGGTAYVLGGFWEAKRYLTMVGLLAAHGEP